MGLTFGFNVVLKPAEEYFEYASQYGIAHMEIDLMRDHSALETFSEKRIQKLMRLAEIHKISVSLHTPYTLNPSELIPMIRKASVKYLKKCIKLAHQLGATHITTHIGYCNALPTWRGARQQALERLCGSLREGAEDCETYKVRLALENVNASPQDSEFFYLGDSIVDLKYIFSAVDSRYLNLCLDVGHANTCEGVVNYAREFEERIIALHYHDNRGILDDHLAIGQGTVPWRDLTLALKKIDFHGPFISECCEEEPHRAKEALWRILEHHYC